MNLLLDEATAVDLTKINDFVSGDFWHGFGYFFTHFVEAIMQLLYAVIQVL